MGRVWVLVVSLLFESAEVLCEPVLRMPSFLCIPPYVAVQGRCALPTSPQPSLYPYLTDVPTNMPKETTQTFQMTIITTASSANTIPTAKV
ncbi:GL16952 [Drosophila persimilis]|uniref:GL16952 n=1 Tax=Drosophila persimilis TaxID=7234 RepID=B4GHF8_DROPE|nr:GL16952 [Drosophila persimilis]